ncbi:unnamed protein product [Closterium sp. NIES-53]
MFQHIKDLVELDDSGPKACKLLRDMIQPNMLPMVIVLEKELAALSMRLGDDHINDLVELDDSRLKAWKILCDVIHPNTLLMVIVLEKELAALSMQPGDGVKLVLDKSKDGSGGQQGVADASVHQDHLGARQLVEQPHPHPQHSAGPVDT